MADIALGLLPRCFRSEKEHDRIIYNEDQDVAEMYFVQEGKIGIAISSQGSREPFVFGRK